MCHLITLHYLPMPTPLPIQSPDLSHASSAVAQAIWVDKPNQYEALSEQLLESEWVGIDTEFVRERTYYPAPGLVQISDGQSVWLTDVIALRDHAPLRSVMTNQRVIKVLHSVGEDLEILALLTNEQPLPLFDTQLAAAFLGFPLQIRYEHLIENVFGAALPGGQARSNWCQRPLSPALLSYAAQDVIYLPRLAIILYEALEKIGRLDWVLEDCTRLVESRKHTSTQSPLLRVKGAGKLPSQAMAYVESLARWRDLAAQKKNLPRSFVLNDQTLLDLSIQAAAIGPAAAANKMKEVLRRNTAACVDAMEKADPDSFEVPPGLQALDNEQRAQLRDWQAKIAELAQSLNVEPALIASKRELTRIMKEETPDWMNGWRGPLVCEKLGLS